MAPFNTQFTNPQGGTVQREPYGSYAGPPEAAWTPEYGTNPNQPTTGQWDSYAGPPEAAWTPEYGTNPRFGQQQPVVEEEPVEVQTDKERLSKTELYQTWTVFTLENNYLSSDAKAKLGFLEHFAADIEGAFEVESGAMESLVDSQIKVIKGEVAPDELGVGGAVAEEKRWRSLGFSPAFTDKQAQTVKARLDQLWFEKVEQGGKDAPAGFWTGLAGTLLMLPEEAASGAVVGAGTGAAWGALGGPAAPATSTAGAITGGVAGGVMGMAAGGGIRARGEALENNYFANLDAGMDSNEAFTKAMRAAEISGALNTVLMAVDPTKAGGKLIKAGAQQLGKEAAEQAVREGVGEAGKAATRTGVGRFATEQGKRFAVAGGINAAGEVVDVSQMRLMGNVDASRYRGSLAHRMALSGIVGGAIHTGIPVAGKAFRGVTTIGDGTSWAAKYNKVFHEENVLGALGQIQRDMEDAVAGRGRRTELADLDVMARSRDVKDQKQAVKLINDIWNDITGGSEPLTFKVVDEDGVKKLRLDEDVEARYIPDYANAKQTIEAFTNIFRWDKETGQRIPLLHEASHAFMDTLPQPVITALKQLYDTEVQYGSKHLDRVDADGNIVRRDNVHPDAMEPPVAGRPETGRYERTSFREWFAERMAIANDEWAKGRINVGKKKREGIKATPKGVFEKLSLVYRDKVDKVSRRLGMKAGGFDSAFRDFLDSGDAYIFDRTMKDVEVPNLIDRRTPLLDFILENDETIRRIDAEGYGSVGRTAEGLKRELLKADLIEGESIPSARDIEKANEWAAVGAVEGRKRSKMEIAEIDAPETAPRMSETELKTAQNRVQEIDEALAQKGVLSRKERAALRKERNQIRQQIGDSFLETERTPRPMSPERRSSGKDTREFADDPEGFRDQYEAGGAERTKIRQEAQADLDKALRKRELAVKKAEREAKAAKKQKAKDDATVERRGYIEDPKTGQLEFDTRSPVEQVRAKPIEELTPTELAFEQQALRDQIASETQAQRADVWAEAQLKNPTDNVEFSKRGISNDEARAQVKQRVEKAKSKKAKNKALKEQEAVEDAAIRIDSENAKHPEALPLQIAVDSNGKVKFAKGKVAYQEQDYNIRNHPDIKDKVDSEQTNFLAEKVVKEIIKMLENPEVAAAKGWYGRMREKLQNLFGADIEIMAQLLGATSARTPVDENFKQALDGLTQLARGEYDDLMVRYDAHVKAVDARRDAGEFKTDAAYRKAVNEFEEVPLRSNGKKFNANSEAVRRVLHGHWLDMTTAPKTPNFAGNLTGRTLEATIDVWAARTMRRLLYAPQGGQWRIQPSSETGVQSGWAAGRGTGDFYISQRAMGEAARRLGMNPDDLQAVMWFGEKDLWSRRGWTEGEGKKKSSFDSEADKLELDRWTAGLTTWQTKETFDPRVQEEARVSIEDSIRQNDELVSARVIDTEGLYGGTRESSFDIEFSVAKESDVDAFIREAIRVGRENNQWDVFVSRVVDADHPNARPAIEVGFKRPVSETTLRAAIKSFDDEQLAGWTIARNRKGEIIGFRAQFIPEIDARWAGSSLDEASVRTASTTWESNMRQAIANLNKDVVAFAREHHYDTRVYGREEYADAAIAGRESTLGAELQRRADSIQRDDSGAAGSAEFSRRGANQGRDGATGSVREDTILDYRGRRTGSEIAEGRNTELAEAAQQMIAGDRTRESYRSLVNETMPDAPHGNLQSVDEKAIKAFLRPAQVEKWKKHLGHKNKDVDVRIDISSHKSSLIPERWEEKGMPQGDPVYPVTVHEAGEVKASGNYQAGDVVGYSTFIVLDGPITPKFDLSRTADIAAGDRKSTIVTVSGKLAAKQKLPTNLTLKDGKKINKRMWHEAAVQPLRSNTLYDRATGRAVRADNVEMSVVHGNTVYLKYKKGTRPAARTRELEPQEYSRRGRQSGPYAGTPVRRFADRAQSSANSQDLKNIYERRADIATYEQQGLREYVDNIDLVADVTLVQSVENLRNRAVDSDRNFDVANAIAYLDRQRREYKKTGKSAAELANIEREIEKTYDAVSKAGTTLGQLLVQYKTFKGIVAEDKVAMLNNYLLSKNRKLTDADKVAFKTLVDAEEAADAIVVQAQEKALRTNDMGDIEAVWRAENEAEKAFLAVQKFARTRTPRGSKFADWRTAVSGSLLTGVSLMRNFWGNYVNFGAATASRSIAATVDNIRSRLTGEERQVAFAPIEEAKAFWRESVREGKKLPRKAMHGASGDKITGESMRNFNPIASLKQAFTGEGMIVDASTNRVTKLDRLDKLAEAFYGSTAEPMLRGLTVMDDLAKAGARGIRRAEYIKAKKLKKGTKGFTEAMLGMDRELNKAMDEFALERTYQQDGAASNLALAIERQARAMGGEPAVFAMRVVTSPYIKTPVNLAAETVSYAIPAVAVAEGLYKGMVKNDIRGAELAAGKVVVGMGLGMMADYLLEDGIISGGPDNSKKVNVARRDSGMGFFRINIDGLKRKLDGGDGTYREGDETWRLDTLGVAGGAFAVHAEGRRVAEDTTLKSGEGSQLDYWLSIDGLASVVGLGRFVMDQTMLRGVALGLDALQSGQLNRVLPNIFNAWVLTPQPMMANNITQLRAAQHTYKYDLYGASGIGTTMRDLYNYKMGDYDGLTLKRDIWGRPIKATPEGQDAYIYHLLDIRKPEVVRDRARVRLYELYAATGQEEVIPSFPSRNLLLPNGVELRLSAGLYESYVETVQGAKLQAFERVVGDPRFNRFYTAQPHVAVEILQKEMNRWGRAATKYWKNMNADAIYNEYLMLERRLQELEE